MTCACPSTTPASGPTRASCWRRSTTGPTPTTSSSTRNWSARSSGPASGSPRSRSRPATSPRPARSTSAARSSTASRPCAPWEDTGGRSAGSSRHRAPRFTGDHPGGPPDPPERSGSVRRPAGGASCRRRGPSCSSCGWSGASRPCPGWARPRGDVDAVAAGRVDPVLVDQDLVVAGADEDGRGRAGELGVADAGGGAVVAHAHPRGVVERGEAQVVDAPVVVDQKVLLRVAPVGEEDAGAVVALEPVVGDQDLLGAPFGEDTVAAVDGELIVGDEAVAADDARGL